MIAKQHTGEFYERLKFIMKSRFIFREIGVSLLAIGRLHYSGAGRNPPAVYLMLGINESLHTYQLTKAK